MLSHAMRGRCVTAPIGSEGQRRLLESRVLIVGCGALGSVLANTLARAGVGMLRIVDRDFLELNNLQRQVLYDEADVASGLPKAIVAGQRLRQINSQIQIDAVVADVDHRNIAGLVQDVDLILDGTDNFEIRYLLNDVAVERRIPWIYGGCIGAVGQTHGGLAGRDTLFSLSPSRTAATRFDGDLRHGGHLGSDHQCDRIGAGM